MKRVAIVLTAIVVLLGSPAAARADAVTYWNTVAGNAALAACIAPFDDPLHESRMYAMTHIAIHDALNAIDRRSRPYAYDAQAPAGASIDAAAAAAARQVLVATISEIPFPFPPACLAAGVAVVEAAYSAAVGAIPNGPSKTAGLEVGAAAAAAVLARRARDGSDTPLIVTDYPQGDEPGEYVFTPGFPFFFAPGWAQVTPFVLEHASQFPPAPPYLLTSQKYADDFNEVKALGSDGVSAPSARTADETQIALFWIESSPLQWNRIARSVSASAGFDAWENARLFGLLNMALADGYVATFDAKIRYNFWRPVTAIANADADGNPDTVADPGWLPLVPTPPIPDHDSGHSVQGGAAAEVLRQVFGADDITFRTCSLTLPAGSRCDDPTAVFRSFMSFSHAAEENGLSRILVGFHFRNAVEEGIKHGRKIGQRAANVFLRPVQ